MNREVHVRFCERLEVKLLWSTLQYLKTSKIKIIYLPPYSPNLNAIERLWKVMREVVTYNKYYEKFTDFERAVREFFTEGIPILKDKLKARITDVFQTIELNPVQLSA